MKRVYIIRAGIDRQYGGFVAPYFEEEDDILYIPIPNENNGENSILKNYDSIDTNFPDIKLIDYFPKDYKIGSAGINEIKAHYDPEFETNTYGENKGNEAYEIKGRNMFSKLSGFKQDDYILFYGSFYPFNINLKYKNLSLLELQNKQRNNLQFYIFAFLKLKYPPITKEIYKEYYDEIKGNVHVKRGDFDNKEKDIFVLKGKDGGYLNPLRIDGSRKGSNYFMNDFLSQFKLNNSRGLNKCYCELSSEIIPYILKHRK